MALKKVKDTKNEHMHEDERKIVIDALKDPFASEHTEGRKTAVTNQQVEVESVRAEKKSAVQTEKANSAETRREVSKISAKKRSDHFWLKTIPFFIVIMVLAVFVFCNEGVFRYQFLSKYAKPIARALHFPVGIVGTKFISINEYEDEIQQLSVYMNTTPDLGAALPDSRSKDEMAFTRLVEKKTLEYGYEAYDISITDKEIDDALFNLIGARRGGLDAQGIIQESFGVSVDSFIENLLRPYLLKRKLLGAIEKDPNFVQTQRLVAEDILHTLADGSKTFAQYLSESKATKTFTASDTAYYRTANVPSEFSSIKELQLGERSQVIEDQNGFHIITVVETIPSGSSISDSTYIRLEHIKVPKPDIRWWLTREYQKHSIVIIAPTFSWQPLCEQVIIAGTSCTLQASTNLSDNETAQDALDAALRESQNLYLPQ